jgi:outer membrane protein assembly factor BamB
MKMLGIGIGIGVAIAVGIRMLHSIAIPIAIPTPTFRVGRSIFEAVTGLLPVEWSCLDTPMKKPRQVLILGWIVLFSFCTAVPVTGRLVADRAQWGQRWSRNMASDEHGLPESFDSATGRNVKWVARLGTETHSTPVVAQGRVFIGTNNGAPRDPQDQGDRGVLMCFDERDGRFLWQLAEPKLNASVYWDWPHAGICSPATVDDGRVFITSNRGEVLCLDPAGMANGNDGPYVDEGARTVSAAAGRTTILASAADVLWRFDILKECGVRQHDSAHASILSHGRFLYVNTSNGVDDTHKKIDAPEAPSLIVLDKVSGRLVATDGEGIGPRIFHSTWSSPALAEVHGRELVFFAGGNGVVYAFEPLADDPNALPAAGRSVAASGSSAPSSGVARLRKVWQFDCDPGAPKEAVHRYNGNRRESPSNVKSMPVFYNNRVYVTVGGDLWWGKRQAWIKCIDASKTGDITKTGEVWSYPLVHHSMSTPAIGDGLVYVGDSGHTIHCLDAETGKPYWTHTVEGEIWASPLLADGKVCFATRQGEVLLFKAGKEKKLLGEIDMNSPISSSPVAANGVLYIATMTHLYAVHGSR